MASISLKVSRCNMVPIFYCISFTDKLILIILNYTKTVILAKFIYNIMFLCSIETVLHAINRSSAFFLF